jgi:DNA-binding NarL/FixJ family response regulator
MASTDLIRILSVDDHSMLRDGVVARIATQPDMVVVGEASDGVEAVEKFRELRPDVTLMDLQMPGEGGLWAIRAIRKEFPKARIVVLTTYEGDVHALSALKAGAAGYLLKSALRKELLDAIRAVHAGKPYIEPKVAQELAAYAAADPLTEREIDILKLVALGMANKEIGRELSLSEDTIKAHLKSAFAKLDVADRTHAVTVAARRGLINI